MQEPRNEKGQTLAQFLSAYDENKYRRPSVTVDMAVFTLIPRAAGWELAVLLIRRKDHPNINTWALPGGFIHMDEELNAAAARELEEETGVCGVPLRPFGSFGAVNRDPRTRIITCGFFAVAPMGSVLPKAGDDAGDAAFFTIDSALEAASASAETYRLTLLGPRLIAARAKLCYDELGPLPGAWAKPGEGGLGGDHDLVLFAAVRALNALPRARVARLLARDNPAMISAARAALNRALGAIPREAHVSMQTVR